MFHTFLATWLSLGLLVGMLVMLELGTRIGRRALAKREGGSAGGTSAIDGALFALLGLLIAFTFSGAATRFDGRRTLIVQEANDIGTAWLRLDLLPPAGQPALRDLFRRYTDSRIRTYQLMANRAAARTELDRTQGVEREIWAQAVAACKEAHDPPTTSLVIASLNTMFDTASTRIATLDLHPPDVVYVLLFVLALGCALLSGHAIAGSSDRLWVHRVAFAVAMAVSVYVILDLEHPRLDLIRIHSFDRLLLDVRQSMH